ncbi:MAG: molybdenum cofactor guanylyltransferase, partial [Methanobacterium sp.]
MKSVIILCGGRSTRMGKDKGSLLFKGKPMILHVYDGVKEIADEIIIVLRDPEQVNEYIKLLKTEKNTVIVTDESKDQGPLVGIFSGLSNIKSDKAQVLPCDSPYISKKFILKMFKIMEKSDFD